MVTKQVLEEKNCEATSGTNEPLIELGDMHLALVGGGDANVVWA
jgi:hypothetical protein